MGIRVTCPNCNRELNVKSFLAGKRGVCPDCKAKFDIPSGSPHNVILEVEDEADIVVNRRAGVSPPQPIADAGRTLPRAQAMPAAMPAPPSMPMAVPAPVPVAAPAVDSPMVAPPVVGTPRIAAPVRTAAAIMDPIAEAPHASWHVSSPTGERYGPITGDVLRQWVAQRQLMPDSLVWREGWPQWLRADAVFAELAAAGTPIIAAPMVAAPMVAAPMVAAPVVAGPTPFPAGDSPVLQETFPSESPRLRRARSYNRRSQGTRTAIMVILILAVLILAPLLGYVLVQQF